MTLCHQTEQILVHYSIAFYNFSHRKRLKNYLFLMKLCFTFEICTEMHSKKSSNKHIL